MEIKIGGKTVGPETEPYIIVEAGINHNGELEKAFQMIDVAKNVGADAIKFQTFKAEEFIADETETYTYKSQGKEVTESMLKMFKRYEFTRDEWFKLKDYCVQKNITFLSTAQNLTDLNLLLEVGIDAIKVGSDDLTFTPQLKKYAETGLPIILSSGMSNLAEVYQGLEAIGAHEGYPSLLMLCTSQYPTPPEDANIQRLKSLKNSFPSVVMGFSDHTQGYVGAVMSYTLGARIFEKHFTLDHDLPGPDHWFSETPETLREWVKAIRTAHLMSGTSLFKPTKAEEEMRAICRRSIVAIRDIAKGETINPENLAPRRPAGGIHPMYIDQIMGLISTRNIKQGEKVSFGDFTNQ